uniref:DNA-processing protein DprA n=1 Tax=uncultured Lactobacillus sp. TaxID=153152 RepID=UPI00260D29F7
IIDQIGYYEEEINFDLISELELSSDLRNKIFNAMTDERFEKCIERILLQCEVITIFDPIYPAKLKETFDPPIVLFARGNLELLKKNVTVIVGSRNPTQYSRQVLRQLVPNIVNQGFVIASGLAKGVDAIAHEETLKSQGNTIAVVGNGLNYFYPRQNQELQKEIIKRGLLLSEYLPDTPPLPFRFSERNLI